MQKHKGNMTRQRILIFIQRFTLEHGYPPSRREIARGVGKAVSNVAQHLEVLRKQGIITSAPHLSRTIALTVEELPLTYEQPSEIQIKLLTLAQFEHKQPPLELPALPVVPLPAGTWMPGKRRKRQRTHDRL